MEMKTPHTSRTTAPTPGGVHPWGTGSVTSPVSPQTHTHSQVTHFPTGPRPTLSPQGLGAPTSTREGLGGRPASLGLLRK